MNYPDGLTKREVQIIILLILGTDTKMIADKMNITVNTYHAHIQNIYIRTGTHSVQALIKYAHGNGFDNDGNFLPHKRV